MKVFLAEQPWLKWGLRMPYWEVEDSEDTDNYAAWARDDCLGKAIQKAEGNLKSLIKYHTLDNPDWKSWDWVRM